ncbi:Kynurenine formamidase [Fusarium torreyae]|uniref:Kynurenine formamidase n=1 Tax=Fusarium torreyae TaxID=1237075 RepID=A0A9W8RNM6_9HYPO|nr:Kynurenine formamidase [Fusarium torreyae]
MADLAEDQSLGLTYTAHHYGKHSRQKLGVWRFSDRPDQKSGYWVVFIHGGAWRDPRNDENDFTEAIKRVVISGAVATLEIAGFISIDYRLSPHPDFAQESANAKHPDHLEDVWSALDFLKSKYELSDYILVGHSAGATLAFQLLMGDDVLASHPKGPLPTAIIGVSSIVDLVGLDDRHDGQYAGFIQAAFGEDKSSWEKASPARFGSSFKDNWADGKLVILAWSSEDSLIDEPEIDNMASLLTKQGLRVEVNKDLRGEHDFVWQDGSQIARLVITALHHLRRA